MALIQELQEFRELSADVYYTKLKDNLKSQIAYNPFAEEYELRMDHEAKDIITQRLRKDGMHVRDGVDKLSGGMTALLCVTIPDKD